MNPTPPPATPPAAVDPFRYGWRYVKRTLPSGEVDFDQVPLTLEDVLHPEEGDFIVERTRHEMDCGYLADVFRSRPLSPPFARVTADLRVDWGVPGLRAHGPDIAVFVGLREEPDLEEGTLHLGGSGGRCLLVVEVVSPDTRDNDVVTKVGHYHQAGIPLYAIIDQEKEGGPRQLVAYRWEAHGYQEVQLDHQGRLLLRDLGLYLSVRDDRVVCQDATTGRELGDYAQISRELEEANRRDQERERELEGTVEQLRDESRARRDADKRAADAVQARELAEQQRELAEQQRGLADRQRESAERDKQEAERQKQEAERQKQEAERQKQEAERQKQEAERQAAESARARETAERQARAAAQAQEDADRKARAEAQAREDAQKQAQAEAQAREQAEKRVRDLEALLSKLQGDAPAT